MNDTIYPSLEAAVADRFGASVKILRSAPVGGGDINEARCLRLSDGSEVFLKSNSRSNAGFFAAEVQGLEAIASTGTIRTPAVLGRGVDGGTSFLLLEMVRSARPARTFWEDFGHRLAALHSVPTTAFVPGGRYGFCADNYIGATPQVNEPRQRWVDFFRTCRLEPQVRRASHWFSAGERKNIDRLLERLETRLPEPDHPSLLHGDLWSGNFLTGPDGDAWLIDPAAYVGHAEADLAMTELFGGFSGTFYAAYQELCPLERGYRERRELYNLYHLLNHLNLFGGGYLSGVIRTVERFA